MTDKPFIITRTFNAPRELVFACFTDVEHLKHWSGPAGTTVAKSEIDLTPGGTNHYGLNAPDGSIMWGLQTYKEINAPEKLVYVQSFSDENRAVTRHPLAPTWPLEMLTTVTFDDAKGKTLMTLKWETMDSANDDERGTFAAAHDGMTMGWGGSFDKLETYLKTA
jgi:uncharacterized protein YndB with AHSA1/START domain